MAATFNVQASAKGYGTSRIISGTVSDGTSRGILRCSVA
jgi:hypothetical protein